ncbi:hypothetical protein AGMMS49573_01640 [Endomicrobiia bacterium]|nr:hypothetical protein AGMMS49573_01640 [Endomicrobiia bacterium]
MNKVQEIEYKKIREKLADREYRIGLDLGVGSIGYAVVSLKECDDLSYLPEDIILSGSRIFKSSIGAVERREFRLQRNSHRHHRERMRFLWQLLAEKQLALQSSKDLEKKENSADCETSQKRFPINILKEDPYILRYKALEEKLSLFQLGYVLYHIANHRGTDSVRSFLEYDDDKIKENTLTAKIAKETKKVIDAKKYRTFGEYLYKEKIEKFQQNIRKKVSNRKTPANKNKEFAVTRDVIIKETEKILASQKQYYTYILTDEYIKKIKDAISYQTEKLIPESGYCPYFKDEKRLPRSHKLNEYRRMYEALNNAKYFAPVLDENTGEILSYQEKEFSREEKKILFDEVLLKGMELTESGAKKLLHHLPDGCEVQLQLEAVQ